MKEKRKTYLEPLDVVIVGDWAYSVRSKGVRHCSEACGLYRKAEERCPGTCYRYDNLDDIVFVKMMPETMLATDAEVVTTGIWQEWTEMIEKERHLDTGVLKKRGPKPKGYCVQSDDGRWVGEIVNDGRHYKYRSYDKEEVEKWLADKASEFNGGGGHV